MSTKLARANEEADKLSRLGLSAVYEAKKRSEERVKRTEIEYKAFIFGGIPHKEDWVEGDGNQEKFDIFVEENTPEHSLNVQ